MNDRRRDPRSSAPWIRSMAGRIRGGHEVRVVDLSVSGALIEGARPLCPGARVEVHLALDTRHVVWPGRVARCLVAAIDADQGITYHAALTFEHRIDWPYQQDTVLVSRLHGE
jgi:PilZ domain-containing protein